jgi:hypothetical protein
MKTLATLSLLAATCAGIPALGQMTLPQQRMYESMRGVNSLQSGLDAASAVAKPNEQSHSVSYTLIALVAGAVWLGTRGHRRV